MTSKFKLEEVLGLASLPQSLRQVDGQLQTTVNTDAAIGRMLAPIVKAGGKRLRPSLLIACAQINNQKVNDSVIKLATAVELVHIGSLVHDDIIDESNTRWNIPTINSTDVNQAIVIGDYLLAMGCALSAEIDSQAAQLTALTISQLCSGQSLEIVDKNNLKRSQSNYFKSITGKTAALISLSCVLGGLMAEFSDPQIKALQDFGTNWGLAFQLIDDLMDLVSTEQLYGKPIGKDIEEGIYTYPIITGFKKNPSLQKSLNTGLTEELFKSGAIFDTLNQIHHFNQLASQALSSLNDSVANKLKALPNTYLDWTLRNLTAKSYRDQLLEMQKM